MFGQRGRHKDPEVARRAVLMARMYEGGKTLREIGEHFGVSREWARQCIKPFDVPAPVRPKSEEEKARAAYYNAQRDIKRTAKLARRRKADLALYGCSGAEVLACCGQKRLGVGAPRAYVNQRSSAKGRGIEWRLTFPQWWKIWQLSGRWDQRGQGRDRYCMARKGDVGPYAVGNVNICTNSENIREYQRVTRPRREMAASAKEL